MTAFESRRADAVHVGDLIHTRRGVRTVLHVEATYRMVTITVSSASLGEEPLLFVPSQLVHTEREPK